MTSELFRPRLPLDPFAAIDHSIPWSIPQDLPVSHPQIILILGEPPIHDLIPLLASVHLSCSLVLIATENPPLIPVTTRGPAVRILRLSQPLAAHDAGALRLVGLFKRAQRVAHLWLRNPSPHVIQLAQSSQNGDFTVIEPVSYTHPSQNTELRRYPSPAPSISEPVSSSKLRSAQSTPPPSPHTKPHRTKSALKIPDDKMNCKLFDAIVNFLPHGLPDKALLKHAILVTTLSAQFFASPTCISTTSPFPKADLKAYSHSPTIKTQKFISSTPFSSASSPSNSYSSASQSTSSPSSGSTPDTSPCPSPPPLSRSRDLLAASTPTSRVKKRFSLLFRVAPPSLSLPPRPASEFRPLPEMSDLNENMEGSRIRNVKNAHIVHVLPVGWRPDSGLETNRGDRRASSSSSPLRLEGPSRQPHSTANPNDIDTSGICKPKLVQSIEHFLLSFAYPLGTSISGSTSPSTSGIGLSPYLNKRPKSARLLSSTSIISEKLLTTASLRPTSSPGLKSNTKAYEEENSLVRVSTRPSTSNIAIASNINTPLRPAPYLLAPGVFGRCVLGSRKSNRRSSSLSGYGEDEDNRNHEEDTRCGAQMDPPTDPESTTLTIGEIILLGALDFDHTHPGTGPWNGRAWIGNVGDVVIVGGGPNPSLSSGNAGLGKAKGREVVAINTEMTKTAKKNATVSLPTPPDSLSSNNSAESIEEDQEEGLSGARHTQICARHIPVALNADSSPSHLDDFGNLLRQGTPSGARNGKRVTFNEGVDEALVMSPTWTTLKSKVVGAKNVSSASLHSTSTSTLTSNSAPLPKSTPTSQPTSLPATTHGSRNSIPNPKRRSSSSMSTPTPTPGPSMQNSNTSHVVKDEKNYLSSPSPLSLPLAVQVPPLVIHRDRARSPRGSEDSYDLGLGHGVPVPPLIVSKKPGSRSASAPGLGLGMTPLQAEARSAYGETRSSMYFLEEPSRRGSERKGFVATLRKMGLWKGGGRESIGVGLKV